MIKIKCACKENEKTFKKDIGPFWIGECCVKAGFDHLGRKEEAPKKETPKEEPKEEAPKKETPKEEPKEEAPKKKKSKKKDKK